MINKDRIVPITAVDLLSMYGLILLQDSNNSGLAKLAAADGEGGFAVSTNSQKYIAAEPVNKVTFGAAITACTFYFVAGVNYKGFEKTGATLTVTAPDDGIINDGGLYKGVLSTNALTITKAGF